MYNRTNVINFLIQNGRERLLDPRKNIDFTGVEEVDSVLNDIENYPHIFLLGAQMDRGIESRVAWEIPYKAHQFAGLKDLGFAEFRKASIEDLVKVFIANNLHRYPAKMARIFYNTLEHIESAYEGNAARIWNDGPSSAALIKRFLQFDGMSVRTASKAANMLFRDFKIKLSDSSSLDVTPDYYVRRIFRRTGFINRNASDEELIYCARELHLRYPGIFESPCEEIADTVCKSEKPVCRECPLSASCMQLY